MLAVVMVFLLAFSLFSSTLVVPTSQAKEKVAHPHPEVESTSFARTLTLLNSNTNADYHLKEIPFSWEGVDDPEDWDADDDNYLEVDMPWSFPFYGTDYYMLDMSSNGYLVPHGDNTDNLIDASSYEIDLINGMDYEDTGSGAIIAAWNKDLSSYYYGDYSYQFKSDNTMIERLDGPSGGGDQIFTADAERAVFEWYTETFDDEEYELLNNFEIVLYPDGRIRVDYNFFECDPEGGCRSDEMVDNGNTNEPEPTRTSEFLELEALDEGISNAAGEYIVFGGYNANGNILPDVYDESLDDRFNENLNVNGELIGRSFLYTLDNTPPTVTILSPLNGRTTTTATDLHVTTNEEANCTYTLDNGEESDFNYSSSYYPEGFLYTQNIAELSNGSHTLAVTCADASYNSGTSSVRFTKNSVNGQILYGADSGNGFVLFRDEEEPTSYLYTLNPDTGEVVSTLGAIGPYTVSGIAFDPNDETLYASVTNWEEGTPQLLTLNRSTGSGTFVADTVVQNGNSNSPISFSDITFSPSGGLYGWEATDMDTLLMDTETVCISFPCTDGYPDLYAINKQTGVATLVGESELYSDLPGGLSFDNAGRLYVTPQGDTFEWETEGRMSGDYGMIYPLDTVTGLANVNAAVPMQGGSYYPLPIASLTSDNDGLLFGTRTFSILPRLASENSSLRCMTRPGNDLITVNKTTGIITQQGLPDTDSGSPIEAIAFYIPRGSGGGGGGGGGGGVLPPQYSDETGLIHNQNGNSNNGNINTNTNGSTENDNSNTNFTDTSGHWSDDYVDKLQEHCNILGYMDVAGNLLNEFRPDEPITRAELVKMLIQCTHGDMTPPTEQNPYPDVEKTMWYAPYIEKGMELGWVEGYPDGNFRPNQFTIRAEALKIILLSHFASIALPEWTNPFLDVIAGEWYERFVAFAYLQDFVDGYKDAEGNLTGYFGPGNNLTRAEAAKIIILVYGW